MTLSSRAHSRRHLVFAMIAVALGTLVVVLLVEFVLRFLPVRESLEAPAITAEQPQLRFRSNNEVVFSAGWDFAIVNRVRVNNFGFVNNQDYDPGQANPLLAVIGDSYVEALMLPYQDTLHGRLAAKLGNRGRVYSFGASGSALSQYLAYARYAEQTFRPESMVLIVVGNDFDESLLEYKAAPGFHYLRGSAAKGFDLHLVPFEPSLLGRALRWSALARYLNYNLQLSGLRRRLFGKGDYVGNVAATQESLRIQRSKEVIEYFLNVLPEYAGLAPSKIAFLVDGMRPDLYEEKALEAAQSSYFALMRTYFLQSAKAKGYVVVDMQPRFLERYHKEGKRFEWPFDGHWNSIGHEEAAKAVLSSGFLDSWISSSERK